MLFFFWKELLFFFFKLAYGQKPNQRGPPSHAPSSQQPSTISNLQSAHRGSSPTAARSHTVLIEKLIHFFKSGDVGGAWRGGGEPRLVTQSPVYQVVVLIKSQMKRPVCRITFLPPIVVGTHAGTRDNQSFHYPSVALCLKSKVWTSRRHLATSVWEKQQKKKNKTPAYDVWASATSTLKLTRFAVHLRGGFHGHLMQLM